MLQTGHWILDHGPGGTARIARIPVDGAMACTRGLSEFGENLPYGPSRQFLTILHNREFKELSCRPSAHSTSFVVDVHPNLAGLTVIFDLPHYIVLEKD